MTRTRSGREVSDVGADPRAHPRSVVTRVLGVAPRVAEAIEAIAKASFSEGAFSLDEELTRPWSRIWTAQAETRVTGFLIAWHVADELHVLNVATAPDMRRRGIGTDLMLEALDYARAERVRIVLLEVRRSNRPAIKLYRSLGFTAMGIRPKYYSDDGEDAVEMILGLDPLTGRFLEGRDEVRLES